MGGINKRIFGMSISDLVKNKLTKRQYLAGTSAPGDSIDLAEKMVDHSGKPIPGTKSYTTNFDGIADLSSRTPVVRLWTALELQRHTEVDRITINEHQALQEQGLGVLWDEKDHITVHEGNDAVKKEITKHERIIYEIGNHNISVIGNILDKMPNERVGDTSDKNVAKSVFPNIYESNNNQYLKPPAGITSVNCSTEGALGVIKKATVNFRVYNFHDFDKIYSRYFCKPGAQLFLDFGWDTSLLYNPRELIFDDLNYGKSIDSSLFGSKGIVTRANGDLDILIGYVTEYDSKILEDGSVECSVTITSKNKALISHNYKDDDNLYNKIVHQLDVEIIRFAAAHFADGKDLIKPDWNASVESEEEWLRVAEKFAIHNLKGVMDNFPTKKHTITGVYWQTTLKEVDKFDFGTDWRNEMVGASNSKNIYISWGFFEDKILNEELGLGKDMEDILEGEDTVVRYDSSNSFIRFDENLFERQRSEKDATKLNFLYPFSWDESYNTMRDKTPYRIIPPDLQEKIDEASTYEAEPVPKDEDDGILGTLWWGLKTIYNYAKEMFETQVAKLQTEGYITKLDKQNKRIPLREIFVSVNTIKEAFKNADNVRDAVRSIMDSIGSTSEDIVDLQFFATDYAQTKIAIIDRNFVNSDTADQIDFFKQLFVFNPHSPNSIVKSYDLSFSTPEGELQNMIAIQGLSPGRQLFPLSPSADNQLSMKCLDNSEYNTTDFGTSYLPEVGNFAGERITKRNSEVKSFSNNFIKSDIILSDDEKRNELLNSISSQFSEISGKDDISKAVKKAIDPDDSPDPTSVNETDDDSEKDDAFERERYGNSKVASTVSDYYATNAKNQFYREELPTLLPVKLTLSIYGISSLVPGDVFRVDYLPERYLSLVYFQVMKVSHEVNQTSWTTTLETQMRIRKSKKAESGLFKKISQVYLSKRILEELQLRYIDYSSYNIKKLATKLQPTNYRPSYPSIFDYVFDFVSAETTTINVKRGRFGGHTLGWYIDEIFGSSGLNGDGFSGKEIWAPLPDFDSVFKYSFSYTLDLVQGEKYRLIVHGIQWIVVPASFDDRKLKKIEQMFASIEKN